MAPATAVMAGAIALAAAACAITAPASSGKASRSGSAPTARPRTAATAVLSTAPHPGQLTPATASPSPGQTITAGPAGRVRLDAADDGATVSVKLGQVITVILRGRGMLIWNRPRLAGPAPESLRQLGASGGYPSRVPARASYRAIYAGRTVIIASTDAPCLHSHPPCQIPQRLWRVTVIAR